MSLVSATRTTTLPPDAAPPPQVYDGNSQFPRESPARDVRRPTPDRVAARHI
jgi:hypothetical protein